MESSILNNKFLAHLHKLGIDIRQFSDKTFDGLFNDDSMLDFFNWFLENITSENVLTESEQAELEELERNQLILTEEEINSVLSYCNPSYEELQSLEVDHIENVLVTELDELKKVSGELTDILTNLECEKQIVKREQLIEKESLSSWKNKLAVVQQQLQDNSVLFSKTLDDIKSFLLTEPKVNIDFSSFKNLASFEENVLNRLSSVNIFKNNIFSSTDVSLLLKLEDDVASANTFLILSQGDLEEAKEKVQKLSELLKKKSEQENDVTCYQNMLNNLIPAHLIHTENENAKLHEEIQALETQLKEKTKELAKYEVKEMLDEYVGIGLDLNQTCLEKLTTYRDNLKLLNSVNSCMVESMTKVVEGVDKIYQLRKALQVKLKESETNLTKSINNFLSKKQRYDMCLQMNKHPISVALKNYYNTEDYLENKEEALENMINLIEHANDDSNFVTYKFRTGMQSSVRLLFNNSLCGPTSQIMFTPIDLLIKFQNCKERSESLSNNIKRLARKHLDAEEAVSQSDRKIKLLWMDVFKNVEAFQSTCQKKILQGEKKE